MKGLLLLLGVGAAIYTLLIYTHDLLPGSKSATLTQPNHPVTQHVSSWGAYLPLYAKIRHLLHCLRSQMRPMSGRRMTPAKIPS